MAPSMYRDRAEAGRNLAKALGDYAGRVDLLVLALPRGGVPVAYEVAQKLPAPLDLLIVRKLGVPGQEELAIGAIASGGAEVLNPEVVEPLRISPQQIQAIAQRERTELARRERLYRQDRPPVMISGRCVIVVDDGLATGASMRVAVAALRQKNPSEIVVAVPVAPPDTVQLLRLEADEVVCPATPEPFFGVGRWYEDFTQTTDEEVKSLLAQAWRREAA